MNPAFIFLLSFACVAHFSRSALLTWFKAMH